MSQSSYRIGIISDTHGYLNPHVFELFEGVDLILHAGDVGHDDILTELEVLAPVQAVSGNVDGHPYGIARPLQRTLETPAGRIALTHGHLPQAPAGDDARMLAHFADFAPAIIIHGHTHIRRLESCDGVTFFNPGAAGRVRSPHPASVGMLSVVEGQPHFEYLELASPASGRDPKRG